MPWIESHSELREHPKRKRLSRLLGLDAYATIGLLHCLWWWAMAYAPDGDLSRYTPEDIADGIDWPGDPGQLIEALREAGFLDDLQLHDWEEYGEKLYQRRQRNAAQMRARRQAERAVDESTAAQDTTEEHVESTCTTRVQHVLNTCETRVKLQDRTGQDIYTATNVAASDNGGPPAKKRAKPVAPDDSTTPSLVAYYVDHARSEGLVVTDTDRARVGRYIKQALNQGAEPYVIRAALERMVERRLGPHLLGQLINEVQARAAPTPEEHERLVRELLAKARGDDRISGEREDIPG